MAQHPSDAVIYELAMSRAVESNALTHMLQCDSCLARLTDILQDARDLKATGRHLSDFALDELANSRLVDPRRWAHCFKCEQCSTRLQKAMDVRALILTPPEDGHVNSGWVRTRIIVEILGKIRGRLKSEKPIAQKQLNADDGLPSRVPGFRHQA